MKNLKFTLVLLILLVSSTIAYSQNYSRLVREKGLVMQRIHTPGQTPDIGVMDFHSNSNVLNPDFIYMRATAETDSLNPNNLVLTDEGLLAIGQEDDCSALTIPDFGEHDVKLYVNGDIATKSGNITNIVASDEKLKKNIKPLSNSLEIIRQSNFVEFQYNGLLGMSSDKTYYGIIAQEMQQVLPNTIKKSVGKFRTNDKKGTDFLMFNPNDLIYSGLNAIKELDQENQTLKDKVNELEEKVAQLEQQNDEQTVLQERVDELSQLVTQLLDGQSASSQVLSKTFITGTSLSQNTPNPLRESTDIEYVLPEKYTNATLLIQDLDGRQIAKFDLNNSVGKITFRPQEYGISTGTYVYSLIIDGNTTATKKMIFFE